jgi:prolyl oligopeptidase
MRLGLLAALAIGMIDAQTLKYPATKKADVADDYHGTKIADPYRWLEDTDSPETAKWVEAQNAVTREYLSKIPRRASFKDRLLTLYNYERFNGLERIGPRYLLTRNDGLQNQDVLYVADSLNGKERVLLDPNTLRADGTTALAGHYASKDGKLLAYGIAEAGSDWTTWRVRDVETGKDLPDVIRWSKFSIVEWTPDHRGFYYQRFDEPKPGEEMRARNEYAKLYLHRLGEPQSADRLVYERPDQKQWMFYPEITEDGRYLLLAVQTTDFGRNLLFYQDLREQPPKTVELIRELTAQFIPLGTRGSVVYFSTTDGAPRGRIVAIDLARPERANWREIVPQQKEPIDAARMVSQRLVLSYLKDAASAVKVFALDGKLVKEVALPGVGQVAFLASRPADPEMFFKFMSFTSPTVTYRLDPPAGTATVVRQSKVGFDPARFEAERVFYTSKDGTRIPMALVHRKGIVRNGQTPTILYGYGGFNSSVLPTFNPAIVAWMEMGGMFAVANIRGGAEYGDEWHEAGKREKKQNVFDDFIAAAEWLIAQKYTSTPKLALYGGSNGGLLVGAVVNQRPDLFGAAMPAVGVMDMLRFQKFTIGAAWVDEYGSSDDPAQFKTLRAYSPLHNIKAGAKYPAVFITTSDHDDRVVPGHSFKYAAALQEAQQSADRPALIRIETRAGHGAGKPVTKIIEEWADRLAFLSKELGVQ